MVFSYTARREVVAVGERSAVANGLFEDLDELEEALVERCVALLERTELVRSLTLYHWWPRAA
jgi:hypothetical protein